MNFSSLIDLSDGDEEFLAEFIHTFETSSIQQAEDLLRHLNSHDYESLKQIAHQLKPTAELLGMSCHTALLALNQDPREASKEQIESIIQNTRDTLKALKSQFSV